MKFITSHAFIFCFTLLVSSTISQAVDGAVFDIFPSNANAGCNEEFENIANTLQPGDELVLHGGIYTQTCRRAITINGTAENPIVIRAAEGEVPVLTRPQDSNHQYSSNNIEIVDSSYLIIKGVHFQRGDIGVRIIRGNNITFEDNEIDQTGNNALAMNSGNTNHFIIRSNHIHHTGLLSSTIGTTEGEGMYIGCNNASCIASHHIIENNYIHNLRATSGGGNDGIEIKPGSFGNIIRNNVIHDTTIGTRYPCIFVYGGGASKNIVEGNALWNCGEAIQVAADADIRNNLIFNSDVGITAAPHSQSPQVKNVHIINNTLYGHQTCLTMRWNNAQQVTLANNAIYCPDNTAIQAVSLPDTLTGFRANFVSGNLTGTGIDNQMFFDGGDTTVFTDPSAINFWPVPDSVLINSADPAFSPSNDFNENQRTSQYDVGAYETDNNPDNPGWTVEPGFKTKATTDTDNDGIPDSRDNCIEIANTQQTDTDADGYGNRCDADFDNSGFVNLDDFDLFVSYFGTDNPLADFDLSGFVNLDDFDIFVELFGKQPGPSADNSATIPKAIRNLNPHTWAPISQNTLVDVDPCQTIPINECGYSAVEDQSGVLNDYHGGAFASEEGTLGGLIVWGGGHTGHYGNEIYFFDLSTLLWSRKSELIEPSTRLILRGSSTIEVIRRTAATGQQPVLMVPELCIPAHGIRWTV